MNGNAVKESSNRLHKWYWSSLEEISLNPVPYDAQFGSPDFGLGHSGKWKFESERIEYEQLMDEYEKYIAEMRNRNDLSA